MKQPISGWVGRFLNTYTFLLLLVITSFVLPLFPAPAQNGLYLIFFGAIFLGVVFLSRKNRGAVLGIVAVALISKWLIAPAIGNIHLIYLAETLNMLVFFYAVGMIIADLVRAKEVDAKTVVDAISGYLLIGVAMATLVMFVEETQPGSFSFSDPDSLEMRDYIYFSLVTLSTLGYGDVLPQLPAARSLATLISVVGQMYVAVIVALLVGKYASRTN